MYYRAGEYGDYMMQNEESTRSITNKQLLLTHSKNTTLSNKYKIANPIKTCSVSALLYTFCLTCAISSSVFGDVVNVTTVNNLKDAIRLLNNEDFLKGNGWTKEGYTMKGALELT